MNKPTYNNQYSFKEIVEMLKPRSGDIFKQFFPNAIKHNTGYSVGSFAGEKGESLSICTSHGHKDCGKWREFNGASSGDILDLVCAVEGINKGQAIRWAKGYLGLQYINPEELALKRVEAEKTRKAADEQEKRRIEKSRGIAKGYYLAAKLIGGTLAERYLIDRNVPMPEAGWPSSIKFHPAMHHSETGQKYPCMLCYICRGDGEFMTIHRIYLEAHEDGKVTKLTKVDKAKKAYGGFTGGFVPIAKGANNASMRHMLPDEQLMICEGIEDALILSASFASRRIVAAVSLGNVGAIAEFLPDTCRWVLLIKDNDTNEQAKKGFERALEAHAQAGRRVTVGCAPEDFKDINDWLDSLKNQ